MTEEITKIVEEMMNQEKWTRTAISAYGISNIRELDGVLHQIWEAKAEEEVVKICETHLVEAKNSIVALYFTGMISLKKQLLDDSSLVRLISLFVQQGKWPVVEFICNRILEFGENKFSLRTLVDCYRTEGDEEKLLAVEERLIRVDIEEADIVFALAQKAEKEGERDKSIDYYKKAIHRFILRKNFPRVRDVWLKLMDLVPEEFEYFSQIENKVSRTLGWEKDKSIQLLEDLYPLYIQNKEWDLAISILLKINAYDVKIPSIRKEVVDCLKHKYADTPKVADYIRLSNIQDSWKPLADALEDFKKHMAYEKGNFVLHKAWGVGRIREIKDKEHEFVIDFEKKRNHNMAQKMAVEALIPLQKDDIRVIIATTAREDLKKRLKSDLDWALRTLIKSYENSLDLKTMKDLLVPLIFTNSEWTTWQSNARNHLKTNENFALSPDKADRYSVRTQPITYEEKTYNKFRVEKDFFKRVGIVEEFLENDGKVDSDYFAEMFNSFVGYLRTAKVNEEVISSFLLITRMVKTHAFLNPGITKSFADLYKELENPEAVYEKIGNTELRKEYLLQVRANSENWPQIFVKIFPKALLRSMLDDLASAGQKDLIKGLFVNMAERYREEREAFTWLAKYLWDEVLFETYGFNKDRFVINLVNLLEITFRDMNNKKETPTNKKVNKAVHNFLFKEGILEEYVEISKEEQVSRVYTLIEEIKELSPNAKADFKLMIQKKFKKFTFRDEVGVQTISQRKGLLASSRMYNLKVKELQNILDIEVPKNSKEIGEAMALGDLKENAEYHAAKEKQNILNANVATLNKEIDNATVIEKADVDITKVGFGTVVHLLNNLDGKKEVFTILGPWESNPTQNIISYLSPLGDKLMNNKVGDNLKFTINERKIDYVVEKIETADF